MGRHTLLPCCCTACHVCQQVGQLGTTCGTCLSTTYLERAALVCCVCVRVMTSSGTWESGCGLEAAGTVNEATSLIVRTLKRW